MPNVVVPPANVYLVYIFHGIFRPVTDNYSLQG